jgi:hypothetical protein
MATAVQLDKGKRREWRRQAGGFSGKAYLFLSPRKPSWREKQRNGHLGSRREGGAYSKMFQEQHC